MKTQTVKLLDVLNDTTFQFRVSSLGKNVSELKRLYADEIVVDFPVLWKQGEGYLILDGYQRIEAAREVWGKDATIKAKIAEFPIGDYRSAFLFAISANQKHGAQLDKSDRANMAKAMLKEFPKFSNVQIAQRCGLAESTVRGYRNQIPEAQSDTRVGADGREISVPTVKIKTKQHADKAPAKIDLLVSSSAHESMARREIRPSKPHTQTIQKSEDNPASKIYQHHELERLGINTHELVGQLNDFTEDLEQLRSYLEYLPMRPELSFDDLEQAQAIQSAIFGLHEWRKSAFVAD